MSAPSGKMLAVGLRHAQIFALDSSGYPAATDTTLYSGLEIVGPKVFNVTLPETRKITHPGNDRVLNVDQLPSLDGASAELTAARNDYDVYALLTGTKEYTIGEAKIIGLATSKQGSEPQMGMLLYQQALDGVSGARVWRSFLIPKGLVFPKPGGMNENNTEHVFTVQPQVVSKHVWGKAFAIADEGYTTAQVQEMMTEYKPKLAAFQGDGTEDEFLFDVAYPAVSVAKITVWVDGVIQSAGITPAVTGVTFTAAPADGAMIVVLYEFE
jgi:hypothetical protein